jgi:uncharacterized protein
LLTALGIGEALVTCLNEKGVPTPLVHTLLCSPRSRMDVLTDAEINQLVANSSLVKKYSSIVDSQSAYEILTQKIQLATTAAEQAATAEAAAKTAAKTARTPKETSVFDNPMVKQASRTAVSVITRTLLGVLGLGGRRRKSSLW